ncbi:MAG: GAF domain-containing protein [Chlorobi bacterium]|nr:GAF domain-containing protein [Chlorobiota bacterium]
MEGFRFTIANKLIAGFGILTIAVLLSSIFTLSTLNKSEKLNNEITSVYTPSVSNLSDMYDLISNSKMLIKNWVFIERQESTPDKQKLIDLHTTTFPKIKSSILKFYKNWSEENQLKFDKIVTTIEDTLFKKHSYVMENLSTFESYDDPMIIFEINPMVEEGGEIIVLTDSILSRLNILMTNLNDLSVAQNNKMVASFNSFKLFIYISGLVIILAVLLVAFVTIRSIVSPIKQLKSMLITMSKGILKKEKLRVNNDEIGDMTLALDNLIDNLEKTAEFSLEIGKGNFNTEFKPLSDRDILGNSLITMRDDLMEARENNEKRKNEDTLRNWSSHGITMFSDILRKDNDDLKKLSFNIMTNLIDYIKAIQGALFIINDTDQNDIFYELTSAIAYGRDKFMQKKIYPGEGLVGRCVFEKLTIYLREIPEDFVIITSGLGDANPTNLLLVPLIINDEVFGVIELASFNEMQRYEIEFVEKLGENIASTISGVKINERTARLLEQSQQQSEELAAQEEEMRQNMEELQATQEESTRKEQEMRGTVEAINYVIGTAETDLEGNIFNVNKIFTEYLYTTDGDLIGNKIWTLLTLEYQKDVEEQWHKLSNGVNFSLEAEYQAKKTTVWLTTSFYPLKDENGDIFKVLVLVIDKTKSRSIELRMKEYLEKINILTEEIELAKQQLEEKEKDEQEFKEQLMEETEAQSEMLENKLKIAEQELDKALAEIEKLKGK